MTLDFRAEERDRFIDTVMLRLPTIQPSDLAGVRSAVATCFYQGFTLDDATHFALCMEEVSPDLPELIALRRMSALREKYKEPR